MSDLTRAPNRRHTGQHSQQDLRLGCLLLGLLLPIALIVMIVLGLNHTHQNTQYPGAKRIAIKTSTNLTKGQIRWDYEYLSQDNYQYIARWYVENFNLPLNSEVWLGRCYTFSSQKKHFIAKREIYVTICQVYEGYNITISRSYTYR